MTWEQQLRAEVIRRARIYDRAARDRTFAIRLVEACARSPITFANLLVWTFDPRRKVMRKTPWITWPWQERLLWLPHRATRTAISKGRDLGVTYVILIGQLWDAVYHHNVAHGVMSKEGGEVWDDTPDSLLGKLEFIIENMPAWARPEYDTRHTKHPAIMFSNGSYISGRMTTPNAWHSTREKTILVDEAARVPNIEQVMVGVEGATSAPIVVSTPLGPYGWWADLVGGKGAPTEPISEGEPAPESWAVVRLSWRDDPRKDAEWAATRKRILLPEIWAQQHEGDFVASDPGRIFSEFRESDHLLTEAEFSSWWAKWGRKARIVEAWDPGLYTSVTWIAVVERYIVALDYRSWRDTLPDDIVAEVGAAGWKTRFQPGREPDKRIADPASDQRQSGSLMSWRSIMRDAGIGIERARFVRPESSIIAIRMALRDNRTFFAPACARRGKYHGNGGTLPSLIESVGGYRRAVDVASYVEHAGHTPPIRKDVRSHVVDAWRYAHDLVLDHETGAIKQTWM